MHTPDMETSRLLYDDGRSGRCRAVTRKNPAGPSGCGLGCCRSGCAIAYEERGSCTGGWRSWVESYSRKERNAKSRVMAHSPSGRSHTPEIRGSTLMKIEEKHLSAQEATHKRVAGAMRGRAKRSRFQAYCLLAITLAVATYAAFIFQQISARMS